MENRKQIDPLIKRQQVTLVLAIVGLDIETMSSSNSVVLRFGA